MRRWLVIVLLVLVPLQLSWAAVGAYCGHETDSRGAAHLGHHAHVHHAEPGLDAQASAGPGQDHAPPAPGQFDQDCGACHLGMAALPTPSPSLLAPASAQAQALEGSPHYRSADPRRIERPNWQAAAL